MSYFTKLYLKLNYSKYCQSNCKTPNINKSDILMGKYHTKPMDYEVYHYTNIFINKKHTKIYLEFHFNHTFLWFSFTGLSIECYQCNSAYDPRCGDPFDSYSLGQVNCSMRPPLEHLSELQATMCRKIIQKGKP
jgi:hypothetical protein